VAHATIKRTGFARRNANCNLCGADDYTVRFPKGFAQLHRIGRCNRCGLMSANPQGMVNSGRLETEAHPKVFEEAHNRVYFQMQQFQLPDNGRVLSMLNGFPPARQLKTDILIIIIIIVFNLRRPPVRCKLTGNPI